MGARQWEDAELEHWRDRAIAAEAEVKRLRASREELQWVREGENKAQQEQIKRLRAQLTAIDEYV